MHAKMVKKTMYICTQSWVVQFMKLKKYKIRSCIIYLPENQVSLSSIHEGEKLKLNFYRALTMQTTLV